MKVLALVVLIFAISGMEGAVVKREVDQGLDKLAEFFQGWYESLKVSTQELKEKYDNGQLQAQAEGILEQTKDKAQPIKEEIEKLFSKLIEAAKQWQ
ncbi:apolipoprotein A-II [Mixophyes fleayi]|uniref:apolipoprotein A-II n=1 Tax=Mixophyes fleayi TaxID=3061075 RepID=UPI003F4DD600